MEIGEPRQLVVTCPHCGDNKVIMARQVKKEEVESNPAFAEFMQVSRTNSPVSSMLRHRAGSTRSKGSCRHRGTPGHKCSNRRMSRTATGSMNELQTSLTGNGSEMTVAKNGSNGRANSIHLMEESMMQERKAANDQDSRLTWREQWQRFMEERDDYSLWFFPRDHKCVLRPPPS